ncbi:MAG: acyltransferase family protein [Methanoregulaceae archaeon]
MRRVIFLDAIRAFAILLVIFVHMQNFLSAPVRLNSQVFEVLKFIALACFTFASGCAIASNNMNIRNGKEVLNFYKKRIVRMYPLYFAALFIFFLCFQVVGLYHPINYSIPQWIANILCLQVILSPAFLEPVFTLWFIGFIMMMYAMYPLFLAGSGTLRNRLLFSLGIFVFLIFVHLAGNIVDYRFFLYYFFFIAGTIAAGKNDLFLPIENRLAKHSKYLVPAIVALSVSSYSIYLFHMPVFAVTGQFVHQIGLTWYLQNGILLFLIIPGLIVGCYYVQKSYDAIIKGWLVRVWHVRYQQ